MNEIIDTKMVDTAYLFIAISGVFKCNNISYFSRRVAPSSNT